MIRILLKTNIIQNQVASPELLAYSRVYEILKRVHTCATLSAQITAIYYQNHKLQYRSMTHRMPLFDELSIRCLLEDFQAHMEDTDSSNRILSTDLEMVLGFQVKLLIESDSLEHYLRKISRQLDQLPYLVPVLTPETQTVRSKVHPGFRNRMRYRTKFSKGKQPTRERIFDSQKSLKRTSSKTGASPPAPIELRRRTDRGRVSGGSRSLSERHLARSNEGSRVQTLDEVTDSILEHMHLPDPLKGTPIRSVHLRPDLLFDFFMEVDLEPTDKTSRKSLPPTGPKILIPKKPELIIPKILIPKKPALIIPNIPKILLPEKPEIIIPTILIPTRPKIPPRQLLSHVHKVAAATPYVYTAYVPIRNMNTQNCGDYTAQWDEILLCRVDSDETPSVGIHTSSSVSAAAPSQRGCTSAEPHLKEANTLYKGGSSSRSTVRGQVVSGLTSASLKHRRFSTARGANSNLCGCPTSKETCCWASDHRAPSGVKRTSCGHTPRGSQAKVVHSKPTPALRGSATVLLEHKYTIFDCKIDDYTIFDCSTSSFPKDARSRRKRRTPFLLEDVRFRRKPTSFGDVEVKIDDYIPNPKVSSASYQMLESYGESTRGLTYYVGGAALERSKYIVYGGGCLKQPPNHRFPKDDARKRHRRLCRRIARQPLASFGERSRLRPHTVPLGRRCFSSRKERSSGEKQATKRAHPPRSADTGAAGYKEDRRSTSAGVASTGSTANKPTQKVKASRKPRPVNQTSQSSIVKSRINNSEFLMPLTPKPSPKYLSILLTADLETGFLGASMESTRGSTSTGVSSGTDSPARGGGPQQGEQMRHYPYMYSISGEFTYVHNLTLSLSQKDLCEKSIKLGCHLIYTIKNRITKRILASKVYREFSIYKVLVYMHNFANFDGIFILESISTDPALRKKVKILTRGHNLYSLSVVLNIIHAEIGYKTLIIEFRDSYKILPASLKVLCKTFKTGSQKHELDIGSYTDLKSITKNLLAIKNYCLQDAQALWEVLLKYKQMMFSAYEIDITENLSVSGLAFKIYRRQYLNYPQDLIEINHTENEAYIRTAYVGGITDVYKPRGENLYYYDINSSYPASMLKDMPCGPGKFVADYEKLMQPENLTKFMGFLTVQITVPKELNLPFLWIKSSELVDDQRSSTWRAAIKHTRQASSDTHSVSSNSVSTNSLNTPTHSFAVGAHPSVLCKKRRVCKVSHNTAEAAKAEATDPPSRPPSGRLVFPVGTFQVTIFSEELKYALKEKLCTLDKVYKALEYQPAKLFTNIIHDFYNKRKKAKQEGDQAYNYIYKLLLNSLYGRFGMKRVTECAEFVDNTNKPGSRLLLLERMYNITNILQCSEHMLLITYLKPASDEYIKRILQDNQYNQKTKKQIAKQHDDDIRNMNEFITAPQISAAIASYSRIHIDRYKRQVEKLGGTVYYSDTDSLVTDIQLPENCLSSELGALKLEATIRSAYFIAPKIYMFIDHSGNKTVKFKGVSKQYQDQLTPEWFESMLTRNYTATVSLDIPIKKNYNTLTISRHVSEYKLNVFNAIKRKKVYDHTNKWIDTQPHDMSDRKE